MVSDLSRRSRSSVNPEGHEEHAANRSETLLLSTVIAAKEAPGGDAHGLTNASWLEAPASPQ